MPNVKPAWMTLIIFSVQGLWNNRASTYIYSEEKKTLVYALQQIQQGAQAYDTRGEGYGFRSVNLGNNNWCMTLCLANIALNLCCGGRFLCC